MTEEEIIQIWNSIQPQGDPTGKKFAVKFAEDVSEKSYAEGFDCGVEYSRKRELDAYEALYDSAYLAGVNLGFDLGYANDNEGKQKVFDSREGYLKALKNQISCTKS